MSFKLRLAFLLCLLVLLNAAGQSPYQFRHLSIENGLSNSNVKAFLKDRYGYLWIGTESGLNRYDGYGFKIYNANTNQANSLWSDDIYALQEDGAGNIWLSCGTTYIVYDYNRDCFISDIGQYLNTLNIDARGNIKVYTDKNKDLWVFTSERIYLYEFNPGRLTTISPLNKTYNLININFSDDAENLFAIQGSGDIWKINKKIKKQENLELPEAIRTLFINRNNRIFIDSQNGIWLYTNQTDFLYYKEFSGKQWKKIDLTSITKSQSNVVVGIIEDSNKQIWIGTDHKGLFIYSLQTGSMINQLFKANSNSSLATNNIQSLYYDNSGIVWIGHFKKGISFYHESFQNFINVQDTDCKDVNAILEDEKGTIWLGTDGNGLYTKPIGEDQTLGRFPMPNNAIVKLLQDRKNRIWIGTYLNGLFMHQNGILQHFTQANSNLSSDIIWTLNEDRNGNIWIGHLSGDIQYLPASENSLYSLKTIHESQTNCLDIFYDDKQEELFVGTSYGLLIYDMKTGTKNLAFGNARKTQAFKQVLITNIFQDNNKLLWLGHSQGLTIWDRETDSLYYIDKENGLCDNIIRGIIQDQQQNIWVTTSNGLSQITITRGKNNHLIPVIRNFSTHDGLMDNYFNSHALYKLQNGNIILGASEGYSIISPDKLSEKSNIPPYILLTGLKIGNRTIQVDSAYNDRKILEKPIEQTTKLVFSYYDKLITLEFTTGDLVNSEKVKYAYKLAGFNDQWIETQSNKIEFSALPSGSYKLLMKACNSSGIWSDDLKTIDIVVKPPVYRSTLAIIFYGLLAIGLGIFAVYSIRRRHHVRLEQQKLKLEREQKANLNEMKLKFFTNISHDLRTPLTLIITPLQTILNGTLDESLRRKLDLIVKNAEQLMQLINSLLDFRKLDVGAETLQLQIGDFADFTKSVCAPFYSYASERGIHFSLLSEVNSLPMKFDPDKVQKIMQNLLSNAFKFTPANGTIRVSLFSEPNCVKLSVADTGCGISKNNKHYIFERFYQASSEGQKTGSGIGLHIVSEYVKMHEGTVSVSDNVPQGTIFEVKLPFREIGANEPLADEIITDEIEIAEQFEPPGNPLLLFVDDNIDFCNFMAESLADEYQVMVAHNGFGALDILQNHDISIVVSDMMMPEMSGTELCNRIKTSIEWSHIPVILLTARTNEESKLEAFELGADDYITKPFNFNLLKLRIQKFLDWREKCHISFSQKLDVAPSEITITSLDEKLIEKAIKCVEEHIADTEFSVEQLGAAVALSRSHLYKKLMGITGKGPAEFIRTIRLKRGRQLLDGSQLQIAEIAYMVGFNTPKRFSINFKQEFGVSPTEYMRQKNSE